MSAGDYAIDDLDDLPRLGPCCICERDDNVTAIVMLDVKGEVPGHGWGCLACGLAADGASAVLCAPCVAADEKRLESLRPLAKRLAQQTKKTIKLIRLTAREEVEEITP